MKREWRRAYEHTLNMEPAELPYTGVGSRRTPEDVLTLMERAAKRLAERGYTLRSGHAPGADQAFERGAGAAAECYLPWPGFERDVPITAAVIKGDSKRLAFEVAANLHPAWPSLRGGVKGMHARNVHQVLGWELDRPSKFLLCWTPDAQPVGGTATAIHLAQMRGVPVFNLADPEARQRVEAMCAIVPENTTDEKEQE